MKPKNSSDNEENDIFEMAKEIVDKHLYFSMRILARKSDESIEAVVERAKQEKVTADKGCI